MALDAIFLDVDGTLLDTNQLHVEAWRRAMENLGYRISADRIAAEIGKGGDQLVPSVLGKEAEDRDGDNLRQMETSNFRDLAKSNGVKPFPGVEELLAELKRRKLTSVLASSSGDEHFEILAQCSGLDVRKLADKTVTSSDAAKSKPSPDLMRAAVKKAGVSAAQCAMIGDTPFDVDSARDAGIVCLGVECGKCFDRHALRQAGARAVFRDPLDLLENLDQALRTASPAPLHMDEMMMRDLMTQALDAARRGMENGEAPIGCVIARGDGVVVASGFNELNGSKNKTAHAEMVTFAQAAGKISLDSRDAILVSTLEPCVMCLGASMEAAIDTILYALRAPADGGSHRVRPPLSPESQMPRIIGNIMARESLRLFEQWLKNQPQPNPQQEAFVKQLVNLVK